MTWNWCSPHLDANSFLANESSGINLYPTCKSFFGWRFSILKKGITFLWFCWCHMCHYFQKMITVKSICSASQLPLYCLCAFAQAPGSWGAVWYQVARMRIRPNFPEEAHSIKHTAGHHGAPKIRRGHVYMYDVYVNIERETYIETYIIYHTYTVHVLCMYSCIRCVIIFTRAKWDKLERKGSVLNGNFGLKNSEVSVHPIYPPYPCYRCPPIHGWVSRRCFAVHRPVVRVHRKVMCSEAPTFGHGRLESLCWNAMVPHHTEYVYTVYLLWVPTE